MMDLNLLTTTQKQQLISYLQEYVTDHKQQLLDEVLPLRTRHITVVLENIFQPNNASAVLRSCECFGLQDVHIVEDRNEYQLNSGVLRGASKWLTLHRYQEPDSMRHCLTALKQHGYKIAATTLRPGAISIRELDIHQKIALCFGTERHGLTEEAHELADVFVKAPMNGFTQSFNISVSAALCLYELTGRLRQSEANWQLSEAEQLDLRTDWTIKSTKYGRPLTRKFFEEQGWPLPNWLSWDEILPERLLREKGAQQ
jgi:tRNA (guanosine-2'-O-)-methyltransferase